MKEAPAHGQKTDRRGEQQQLVVSAAHTPLPIIKDHKSSKDVWTYPKLLNHDFHTTEVKHGVQHYIETEGNPVPSRVHRLNPAKAKLGKKAWDFVYLDDILIATLLELNTKTTSIPCLRDCLST